MFLGVGAGRCGTQSLARILDQVDGVNAFHESYFETEDYRPDVRRMFWQFKEGTREMWGHVGALWLGFVPLLRLQFPRLPIICLHRDEQEVIDSFMKRDEVRRRKWLINIAGTVDRLTPEYLRGHIKWCNGMMGNIQDPVLHLDMDELNSDEGLDLVYDFLGIEGDRRVYPELRRYHVGNDGMPELAAQSRIVLPGWN